MNTWADFFERVDALDKDDPERADFMALLHRNFAVAYPGSWEGMEQAPIELQQRLTSEWTAWALRDVQWISLEARA